MVDGEGLLEAVLGTARRSARVRPALLTRTWMCGVRRQQPVGECTDLCLARPGRRSPPATGRCRWRRRSPARTASARSRSRATITSVAPSAARSSAAARPMPEVAPVSTQTLPSIDPPCRAMVTSLHGVRRARRRRRSPPRPRPPRRAGRRPSGVPVRITSPGLEGHHRRDVGDQPGRREHHVRAVVPSCRTSPLTRRAHRERPTRPPRQAPPRDPRPERAEGVEALAAGPLGVGALEVAGGHVVAAGDAEHVRTRRPASATWRQRRPITSASSPSCSTRRDSGGSTIAPPGSEHTRWRLEEQQRLGRNLDPVLGGVGDVVAADADDLGRHGGRQQGQAADCADRLSLARILSERPVGKSAGKVPARHRPRRSAVDQHPQNPVGPDSLLHRVPLRRPAPRPRAPDLR